MHNLMVTNWISSLSAKIQQKTLMAIADAPGLMQSRTQRNACHNYGAIEVEIHCSTHAVSYIYTI